MKRRTRIMAGAVAALALAVAAGGALVAESESSDAFGTISVNGRATPLVGARGHTADLVATKADRAFYRLSSRSRGTCYGLGKRDSSGAILPGVEMCPSRGVFPSPDLAVLASPGVEVRRDTGKATLLWLDGFAADGVASVHVLARDGSTVTEAPVTANTFHLDVSGLPYPAGGWLVARDANGNEVHREAFKNPRAP